MKIALLKKEVIPFLISFLLLNQFMAFGQDSLNTNKNKFGVTLQISNPIMDELSVNWYNVPGESIDDHNLKQSSFSLGTLFQLNLKNGTTLRLRNGITQIKLNEYNFDLNDNTEVVKASEEATGKQVKINISPGITWALNKSKINFYGGFEIPFNLHGKFLHNFTRTESSNTGQLFTVRKEHVTLPKGYSIGLAAIFGFNYSPITRISFGSEFAPALLYARLSGKTFSSLSFQDYRNSEIATTTTASEDLNKGFTFQENRFSINFSYWFGN